MLIYIFLFSVCLQDTGCGLKTDKENDIKKTSRINRTT
jgi:hypothetical protein